MVMSTSTILLFFFLEKIKQNKKNQHKNKILFV